MGRKLTFFDVKAKKKFSTSRYVKIKRKVRGSVTTFAVARSPYTDIKCYRILRRGRRKGRG